MRTALLLPFSPSSPSNSGVARLEMFNFFTDFSMDRFHFGPAADEDISVGEYFSEASPRNLSNFFRLWKAFRQKHRAEPYEVIWTTMPPLMMALFARVIAKWYRIPLIVDVRDPGIASVVIVSPQGTLTYRIAHRLEKWLYKGATAICVTTPELAQMLQKEFGAKAERISVISNAAVEKEKNTKKLDPKHVSVFYAGTFAPYQVVDPLVDNLLASKDRSPFTFDFYGYKEETNPLLREKINKAHAEKTLRLHPRLPRIELFQHLRNADIVLVPIELKGQKEMYDYAVPLKLYEALAFSKPIVLFGGTAASKRIVEETGIGEICPVDQSLITTLEKILKDYPRYRTAAEKTVYSREVEGKKLLAIFHSISKASV